MEAEFAAPIACQEDVDGDVVYISAATLRAHLPAELRFVAGNHTCMAKSWEEEYRGHQVAVQRAEHPYGTMWYGYASRGVTMLPADLTCCGGAHHFALYGDEEEPPYSIAAADYAHVNHAGGSHKTWRYVRSWVRRQVDRALEASQH